MTPTSSDPLVATLFGIECKRFGNAVFLSVDRTEFSGLFPSSNCLEAIEQEVVVPVGPSEFFQRVRVVGIDSARSALRQLGYELPVVISSKEALNSELKIWRRLREDEISRFDSLIQ